MRRLLYWRVGGLGDTLLNMLSARWLEESFGPVTMAIDGRWVEGVASFGVAVIDEASLSAALFSGDHERLTEMLAPFATIVALRHDPDGSIAASLRHAAPGATVILLLPLPDATVAIPYPQWVASKIGDALGIAPPVDLPLPTPNLPWRGGDELIVAPGSGGGEKRLSLSIVEAIISWGTTRGLKVTLLTGPVEEEQGIVLPDLPHLVSPSLSTLAARIADAAHFIGADSGPTHYAALLGAGTLAIFGPSDPAVWRPFGPRAAWRRSPSTETFLTTVASMTGREC